MSIPPPDGLPWTRVGAYALCVDGDRLLGVRFQGDEPGAWSWTLPGGGVEFGEHPEAAAIRELAEESGLDGRIDGLIDVHSFSLAANTRRGPLHSIQIVYRVAIVGGELRNEIDGSSDRAEWLTMTELARVDRVELLERAVAIAFGPEWQGGR